MTHWQPVRLHYIKSIIFALSGTLVWTAMIIYQVQVVGMDPLQLVLAGTMLEVTIFVCEIPTGIVADLYSRRLSCIIGFAMIGVAYVVMGAIPAFGAILVGHFLWGLGYTFTSGAYDAWLVDEAGQEQAAQAFLRGSQFDRFASIIGIFISIGLGSISLALPIVIGGLLPVLLAVVLIFTMPENGFTPTPREDRSTWGKMIDTFRDGTRVIRRQPALLSILLLGLFFGLYSEGWDRLWQAHLLTTFNMEGESGIPAIVLFGALNIIGMVIGIAATEITRRRVNTRQIAQVRRALLVFSAMMVGGIIVYSLAPSLLIALAAYFIFTQARGQIDPLLQIWTNQAIDTDSGVRATVLSMQSQTDAIGQMAGGPPIGLVGNASLRAAFVLSGAILSPVLWLLGRRKSETVRVEG
ncbi:MAG: MFS transporter [Pleurocapsa minor GSE-CHR-MK-17-07R]|jgi:DHA3 family tetracycline resistance protein-like MFS transporter|nr:MFS transporter [Pleurocapsa minor GSE-CHR-MK 17-07R]